MQVNPVQQTFDTAVRHHQSGQLFAAEKLYRQMIAAYPDHAESYFMLAKLGQHFGRHSDALPLVRKAIALNPANAEFQVLEGDLLMATDQVEQAIETLRRAAQLQPESRSILVQLGYALKENNQIDEGIAAFERALSLRPNLASARWGLSQLRLMKGDFEHGWKDYEARWEGATELKRPSFPEPLWNGADLHGKRILLTPEQGFGDLFQAFRYVPMVRERGAHIMAFATPELERLWQAQEGIDQVLSAKDERPQFDYHCPLMSLPRIFHTTEQTIPSHVPYMRADLAQVAEFEAMIAPREVNQLSRSTRVGLAWSGRPNPRGRSIPLLMLAPLAQVPGVVFHSLQTADSPPQSPPEGLRLVDWSSELHDFADTAALIATLDLVITIDTAVSHLAGAMGKPVWAMLRFAPDWRWRLDREDSAWYPTMRLFRQQKRGDWSEPLERVAAELKKLSSVGI